jgi:hypothetical protein
MDSMQCGLDPIIVPALLWLEVNEDVVIVLANHWGYRSRERKRKREKKESRKSHVKSKSTAREERATEKDLLGLPCNDFALS